ncbi:hypothetical protein BC830DRAFT_1122672 [Chytriomyces sp. MP71]|nr:hypothetical protein BC830DRAFT_1122672 [Chytriomyces sp. MP71]
MGIENPRRKPHRIKMGGGDLNLKKSWHPQTLKNIEKVYLRERKAEDEKKKIAQKMKEIEEQRQMKELQELHEASGRIKKKQERLDWIYGGPAAEGENGRGSRGVFVGQEED